MLRKKTAGWSGWRGSDIALLAISAAAAIVITARGEFWLWAARAILSWPALLGVL